MADKSQIIVFGGSFNPPTLAHQEIVATCLDLPGFSELWVMPSASGYEKTLGTAHHQRLTMLELMKKHHFNDDSRLVVTDFELKHPELLETCHTVSALSAEYTDTDFWYVFGTDSYNDMPNWGRGEILQNELNMIIFERENMALPNRDGIISLTLVNNGHLSSTKARQAAANSGSLGSIVSQNVQEYIEKNRLYS